MDKHLKCFLFLTNTLRKAWKVWQLIGQIYWTTHKALFCKIGFWFQLRVQKSLEKSSPLWVSKLSIGLKNYLLVLVDKSEDKWNKSEFLQHSYTIIATIDAHRGERGEGKYRIPQANFKTLTNKNEKPKIGWPPWKFFLKSLTPSDFGKNFRYHLPWIFNPCASMTHPNSRYMWVKSLGLGLGRDSSLLVSKTLLNA